MTCAARVCLGPLACRCASWGPLLCALPAVPAVGREIPGFHAQVVALDRFRKASEKGEIGQRQVPTCAEKEGLGVDGSGIACLERLSFNFRKKKGFPRGRNLCRLALKTSLYNGRIATTRERVALDPSVDVGSWKERNPQISQARLHVTSDDRWWLPRNTVLLFQKLPQRTMATTVPFASRHARQLRPHMNSQC